MAPVGIVRAMNGLDDARLRWLYARCNTRELIQGTRGDDLLTDLDMADESGESPRDRQGATKLRRRVLATVVSGEEIRRPILFSGLIGSGKSAELRRLVSCLRDEDGYLVAVGDADETLEVGAPLNISDFFAVMVHEAERALLAVERDRGAPSAGERTGFRGLWAWFRSLDAELHLMDRGGALGDVDDPIALGEAVVRELRLGSQMRQRMRDVVALHPTGFVEQVRGAFDDFLRRARAAGKPEMVFVFDSIDHFRGDSSSWRAVLEGARALFGGPWLALPVSTVYTVPVSLAVESGLDIEFMPMVNVRRKQDGRCVPQGYRVLRELVVKRFPPDDLAVLFGADAVEARIERLITESGGFPGALIQLLIETLHRAQVGVVPAVSDRDFERILRRAGEARRTYVRLLGTAAIELLSRVHEARALDIGDDLMEERRHLLARLLNESMIVRYVNGDDWWDVHPWGRELIKLPPLPRCADAAGRDG